jgi:DnaK suppressor protein
MAGKATAQAKKAAKAVKAAAAKKPAKSVKASPAKKAAKPVGKTAAPAKPAAGKKETPKAVAKTAAMAVAAAKAVVNPAPPASAPTLPTPRPPVAPAPPQRVVSPEDVAAATEYLLNRVAKRSEEPIYVDGKRLPTEEELLKMSDAEYMNEAQLAFFKYRLQQMERELLANAGETTEHLRETVIVPDPADRATIEEEHALELRTRDRERKLLKKVQAALARIESGEYGYCEETGDPIGIPRLLARPTATLSLEAQQRREMKQKLYGD